MELSLGMKTTIALGSRQTIVFPLPLRKTGRFCSRRAKNREINSNSCPIRHLHPHWERASRRGTAPLSIVKTIWQLSPKKGRKRRKKRGKSCRFLWSISCSRNDVIIPEMGNLFFKLFFKNEKKTNSDFFKN